MGKTQRLTSIDYSSLKELALRKLLDEKVESLKSCVSNKSWSTSVVTSITITDITKHLQQLTK